MSRRCDGREAMTATAPEYKSPLLSMPEALRELARARNDSDGRTAARELMRALRDGALTLLDNNDRQAPDVVSKALRFIRAFIDGAPAAYVAFEGTYLDRVFVVRQEFERVLGLRSDSSKLSDGKGKGGRKRKADRDAAQDALRDEIKRRGWPNEDNADPKWRYQTHVEGWLSEFFSSRHETIHESQTREITVDLLNKLKAGN
jgi:hypothetical protein